MSVFAKISYLASVGALTDLPPAGPAEFAFAGRSNVGKSSAINALAGRKRLAFASKTPGRTQTLNFFALGEHARLVDLPGYGYAKVPLALRSRWEGLVGGYLQQREGLAGVVLVMDARHPLAAADERLLAWLSPLVGTRALRLAILLTKADKLTSGERTGTLAVVRRRVDALALRAEVLLFSALSGEGVEQARQLVEAWVDAASPAGERPFGHVHLAGAGGARRSPRGRSPARRPGKKKTPGKGD